MKIELRKELTVNGMFYWTYVDDRPVGTPSMDEEEASRYSCGEFLEIKDIEKL